MGRRTEEGKVSRKQVEVPEKEKDKRNEVTESENLDYRHGEIESRMRSEGKCKGIKVCGWTRLRC